MSCETSTLNGRDTEALKLTEEEMAAMETHPRIGADILRYIQALRPVIPMVEHHHERFDGHGYPRRLYGDEISPEARILAIADSFDAMTSERSYRRAMPLEQAIAELRRGRGSQWDADYIDTFIGLLEREGLEMLKKR